MKINKYELIMGIACVCILFAVCLNTFYCSITIDQTDNTARVDSSAIAEKIIVLENRIHNVDDEIYTFVWSKDKHWTERKWGKLDEKEKENLRELLELRSHLSVRKSYLEYQLNGGIDGTED